MNHESCGSWHQGGNGNRKYLNGISKFGEEGNQDFSSHVWGIKERKREIRAILVFES